MGKDLMKDVQEPIVKAPSDVQRIIKRVLEAEREKLYQDKPHLIADVVAIIKEEVK